MDSCRWWLFGDMYTGHVMPVRLSVCGARPRAPYACACVSMKGACAHVLQATGSEASLILGMTSGGWTEGRE